MRFLFTSWLTCALSARQVCLHRRCNALCVVPKFAVWALWAEPSGLAASPPDDGFVPTWRCQAVGNVTSHARCTPSIDCIPRADGRARWRRRGQGATAQFGASQRHATSIHRTLRDELSQRRGRGASGLVRGRRSVVAHRFGDRGLAVARPRRLREELRAQHFRNGNNNATCWRVRGGQGLDQILEMLGKLYYGASVSGAVDLVHSLGGQLNLASAAAATPVAGTGAQGLPGLAPD